MMMTTNELAPKNRINQQQQTTKTGPRTRRAKSKDKKTKEAKLGSDEKRPRTAFTSDQLEKLRQEFKANEYLDDKRRKSLAEKLCLNENQIKIWFQNKRAKQKKQSNQPNPLRGLLVAGGLYNHSTATSDCSESFVAGNRNLDDDEGASGTGGGADRLNQRLPRNDSRNDVGAMADFLDDEGDEVGGDHDSMTMADNDNSTSDQRASGLKRLQSEDDELEVGGGGNSSDGGNSINKRARLAEQQEDSSISERMISVS